MDTIKINKGNSLMVAHASLQGLEAPNTLAGVIAAANRSYWGIESDIRITKDKEFILVHNDNLLETAGVDVKVSEATLAELQQYPIYDRFFFYGMEEYGLKAPEGLTRSDLRVATTEEYIRICKKYGKIAVAEIKDLLTAEEVTKLLDIVRKLDYLDGVIFISFQWENLAEIRRQEPGQTVQFLTGDCHDFTDAFLDKVAAEGFDLDIHVFTVTKELVDRIHARGIKLNVWTVDWQDRAANFVEWGVDYITSNIFE